jgi:hypothetical protein
MTIGHSAVGFPFVSLATSAPQDGTICFITMKPGSMLIPFLTTFGPYFFQSPDASIPDHSRPIQ